MKYGFGMPHFEIHQWIIIYIYIIIIIIIIVIGKDIYILVIEKSTPKYTGRIQGPPKEALKKKYT